MRTSSRKKKADEQSAKPAKVADDERNRIAADDEQQHAKPKGAGKMVQLDELIRTVSTLEDVSATIVDGIFAVGKRCKKQ